MMMMIIIIIIVIIIIIHRVKKECLVMPKKRANFRHNCLLLSN